MPRSRPAVIAFAFFLAIFIITHAAKFPGSVAYLMEVTHNQPILDLLIQIQIFEKCRYGFIQRPAQHFHSRRDARIVAVAHVGQLDGGHQTIIAGPLCQ